MQDSPTTARSLPGLQGRAGSCWLAGSATLDYPIFGGSTHTQTVVIGAGIVGLTAALCLCEAGRSPRSPRSTR